MYSGFGIPPCQPQNCSNDIPSNNLISHEPFTWLTSIYAQIKAWMLLYLLPISTNYMNFPHCVVGQSLQDGQPLEWLWGLLYITILSWISCILWAFLQIFEISHTCISKSISQLYYQKRKCTYKYKYIHLLPQMAGFECGKTLLSNDAHIIFYKKRQCMHMYKHIPLLPHMAMGLCVGKYTLPIVWEDGLVLFYQKRQAPHSPVITCTNTCSTFQKW